MKKIFGIVILSIFINGCALETETYFEASLKRPNSLLSADTEPMSFESLESSSGNDAGTIWVSPFSPQPGTSSGSTSALDEQTVNDSPINKSCPLPNNREVPPLNFSSESAFSEITFQAEKWDWTIKPFPEGSFMNDPHWMCLNPDGSDSRVKTPHNALQYATKETAEFLACALGANEVVESIADGFYCVSSDPSYQLRFQNGNYDVNLNAGLVANTFNRNPRYLALLMIRTEIARAFKMRVPSWEEAANTFNCGKAVLGITLLQHPELASSGCDPSKLVE